jgi:hypothetical protein
MVIVLDVDKLWMKIGDNRVIELLFGRHEVRFMARQSLYKTAELLVTRYQHILAGVAL